MSLWQKLQIDLLLSSDTVLAQLPPADCTGVNLFKPAMTRIVSLMLGFVPVWLVFVVIVAMLAGAAVAFSRNKLRAVLTIAGIAVIFGILLVPLLNLAPTFIDAQC
jgi:hypothetical protein